MKLKWHSLLVVVFLMIQGIGVSFANNVDQYSSSWKVSNSDFPEPSFTLWPTRMSGGQAFRGVFPACTSTETRDCIKSVGYQDAQSRWIEGKLESYFPVDEDFETLPGKTSFKITENSITYPDEIQICVGFGGMPDKLILISK